MAKTLASTREKSTIARSKRSPADRRNFWRGLFTLLLPPPRITVSEFAERERIIPPEACANPGRWRNSEAPHLVAVMDAMSPRDPCEQVSAMFSSQTAKTEGLLNFIAYIARLDPGPTLVVQPNVTPMGERFSKTRVAPMIRDMPGLTALFGNPKSRDSGNTIMEKPFPGGTLMMIGANSPAGLASVPIRYLLGDEIDRWGVTIEGDPLDLARKRTARFHDRKIVLTSSPTRPGVGIHAEYLRSEQQFELHMRCDHCGKTQRPQLRHLIWSDDDPDTVVYVCEHCGGTHDRSRERALKSAPVWHCVKNTGERSKGFWASQIAVLQAEWRDTVREFLAAKDDPSKLQVFTNTGLAEVWEDAAEKADGAGLLARRESYSASALPDDILLLSAGVDVQDDRLECEIVGWRAASADEPPESWGVEYHVLPGDPAQPGVWAELDLLLSETWRTESRRELRVQMACVDSGGHHTQQVYAWCAKRTGRHIYAIKGGAGKRPIWPGAGKKRNLRGVSGTVYTLGVDAAKDAIYSRLKIDRPGPGFSHWPVADCYGPAYFAGLTCEQVRTRKVRGFDVREYFKPSGARNEPLDCRVYALAALCSRKINWQSLARAAERWLNAVAEERPPDALAPERPPTPAPHPQPPEARPERASSFFGPRKSFWRR